MLQFSNENVIFFHNEPQLWDNTTTSAATTTYYIIRPILLLYINTCVWGWTWLMYHHGHHHYKHWSLSFFNYTPDYLRRRRRWCFLLVCPSYNWRSCERILTKFLGGVGHVPGTKGINFGDDPDHRPDPEVQGPKSGFTGLSKTHLVDSDQSCIANLHC